MEVEYDEEEDLKPSKDRVDTSGHYLYDMWSLFFSSNRRTPIQHA
jgi:hypothetical protein